MLSLQQKLIPEEFSLQALFFIAIKKQIQISNKVINSMLHVLSVDSKSRIKNIYSSFLKIVLIFHVRKSPSDNNFSSVGSLIGGKRCYNLLKGLCHAI